MILAVESEEEEESDSSETEKEDDEGIIFVARATSEVLQEGKASGNASLAVSLPCTAGSSSVGSPGLCSRKHSSCLLVYSPPASAEHLDSTRNHIQRPASNPHDT